MPKNELDKKEFYKKLISLVLPITFQQLMLASVSASDALMLGELSQESMSAVSLAGEVQFVFNLFIAAITIGVSAFASQYYGKGNKKAIENIIGIAYLITLPISILFSLLATAIPELIMRLLTNEPTLIALGAKYLRAVGLSYFLCGVSQIYLCIMKNCGNAFQSSAISVSCVIINIVLNWILIFGYFGFPKLGVVGAALATVLSRLIETIWTLSSLLKTNALKIRIRLIFNNDKRLRSDFFKHVLPVFGNEIVWGIGFSMSTAIIGRLGDDAIAANSVANVLKNLLVCLCLGLGSGGSVLVGNELGAGNVEKAKAYGDKLCVIAVLLGALTGGMLLLSSVFVKSYANLTPKAKEYLTKMLFVCAYYVIGKSINSTTIGGLFCVGGDTKFGLFCDAITLWGITVPASLIAAFVLNLPVMAVYVILNLDEIIKLPAVYIRYKKYKWLKDLTIEKEDLTYEKQD